MKTPRRRETLYCITLGEKGNIEAYDMATGEVVGNPTRRILRRGTSKLSNSRVGTASVRRRERAAHQDDDMQP